MKAPGASVHDAVREVITHNRSLYDCVKLGIANYTALAARIRPGVERLTGTPANINTIVVAIKRYADSFESGEEEENDALKDARLSLTDGMLGVSFSMRDFRRDPFSVLSKLAEITDDYEYFRLADTFSVITEDAAAARDLLGGTADGGRLSRQLAKITITVPKDHTHSDIVSYVTEILHNEGIELVNAFFGHDAVMVILNERDAARAYDIMRSPGQGQERL